LEQRSLRDPVEQLKGVGPHRAELYGKLGVRLIGDLLTFYPRDYVDLSAPVAIRDTVPDAYNVIRATVCKKQGAQYIRKGLTLYRVYVTDGEDTLTVSVFNAKYFYDSLGMEETYYFYGKVTGKGMRREMASPLAVPEDEAALIRPVYALTEGLSNKVVQGNVQNALEVWGDRLTDPLPPKLRQKYNICQLRYAVENIHFPGDRQALEIARRRLIFEELLVLQLGMRLMRRGRRASTDLRLSCTDISEFYASLPFTLTEGQRSAIRDGLRDMSRMAEGEEKGVPMNRLIQGDVGSGKTMVAAALCYACYKNGFQSAVMAPTQILAEQHYETLSRQLSPLGVRCCLLTGSQTAKQRKELYSGIAGGEYSLVVGTHALLQKDVGFQRLALVVTDEQHRFGVAQRAALSGKGENPHLLVMSATPIPRTLALIIYGDLDVSVIRELPKGRKPVETFAIPSSKRGRALGFVKKQLDAGRQGYIVCPLIEEGEGELISTSRYIQALASTPLASCRTAALHGRLKPKEKDALMAAFKAGEIQLLVSTTVVEVGVDVPNANVMLIENAERFGLSQLHQLRGRVGRGAEQSYCILISDNPGEENRRRLKVMTSVSDGFQIAEEDLKLRGPGDFFGFRQHGLPELKIADLLEDTALLAQAREAADALLLEDPALKAHRGLRSRVARLFSQNEQGMLN